MIRARGRYRNQAVQLEQPLEIEEGTEVEVDIHVGQPAESAEGEGWAAVGMRRLEQEWDKPEDAIYDDWKNLYGVQGR
jgi:hypothetical protein